jgi:hypothetical protein
MKLLWLGYLVYSLGNYAMKLCIETGLMGNINFHYLERAESEHNGHYCSLPSLKQPER